MKDAGSAAQRAPASAPTDGLPRRAPAHALRPLVAPAAVLARHDDAIDSVRGSHDATVIDDAALERLEERYAEAAVLALDAGFDFIDIKQCHTYLLNELLGARSRDGRYGGDFDARTRFVRNVFARIHDVAGASLMLATRMNVFDGIPYRTAANGIGEPVLPSAYGWGADAGDALRPT